jgi:hypothetical protein
MFFKSINSMKLVIIFVFLMLLFCAVKLNKIMNTQIALVDLHLEHKEWLNKLLFYKDDLKIMQIRLDEIASKNNHQEVLVFVERFQNQFKIQNEQIDFLKHDIKQHVNNIEESIINNPIASNHRKMDDHAEERQKMIRFEELFAELRKDLLSFLSKWM